MVHIELQVNHAVFRLFVAILSFFISLCLHGRSFGMCAVDAYKFCNMNNNDPLIKAFKPFIEAVAFASQVGVP